MRIFGFRIRRLVLVSALIAIAIHAGLLGVLGLRGVPGIEPAPKPTTGGVTLTQVEQSPGKSPEINDRELATQMDRASKRYESRPLEQNLAAVNENLRWLERYSSEQAVSDVSSIVRRSTGARDRAYEPAENPPAGEFDYASMLPYSSDKVTGEDGIERTQQTWVDQDGRVLRQTSRSETTSDGQTQYYHGIYQPDGRFVEFKTDRDPFESSIGSVLDTVAKSPILQRLYREAVLPALDARRNGSKAAPSGGAGAR